MKKKALGRIQIMPGCGVTAANAKQIIDYCHFDWIHSSCSIHKNADRYTDVESIKSLKNAIS